MIRHDPKSRRNFLNNLLVFPSLTFFSIFWRGAHGQVIQNLQGGSFSLFNMQDFSAWTMQGNTNWHIHNKEVVANQGGGLLVSRPNLSNFILELDYWVKYKTQCALFLRCTSPEVINSNTAYQITISESADSDFESDSFINLPKVVKNNYSNRWNKLRVSFIGNQFNLSLNNSEIIKNLVNNQFSSGPIAIGLKNGVIKLRSLQIIIPGRW